MTEKKSSKRGAGEKEKELARLQKEIDKLVEEREKLKGEEE